MLGLARFSLPIAAAVLVIVVGGCAKSEDQLASEALDRGIEAFNAGSLEEARADWQEALRHDPENVPTLFDLGLLASQQGDPLGAENYYRLALVHDPDYGPALNNLSILRIDKGSLAEASEIMAHYLALNPDDAAVHYRQATTLLSLGRTDEAEAEFTAAAALDPTLVPPSSSPAASPGAAGEMASEASPPPSVNPSAPAG